MVMKMVVLVTVVIVRVWVMIVMMTGNNYRYIISLDG